jgi:hypothetical protein
MAQQCGKKADPASDEFSGDTPVIDSADNREPITGRFVRYAGFVCMCGVGMGILAATVLLPSYGKLLEVKHRNRCDALRVKEAEGTIAAMDRFCDGVGSDELLTRRFAWSTMGLKSNDDVVIKSQQHTTGENFMPVTLAAISYDDPRRPDRRIMHLAAKLQQPQTRRGMLMLAGLMIISAVLIFRPPSRNRTAEASNV